MVGHIRQADVPYVIIRAIMFRMNVTDNKIVITYLANVTVRATINKQDHKELKETKARKEIEAHKDLKEPQERVLTLGQPDTVIWLFIVVPLITNPIHYTLIQILLLLNYLDYLAMLFGSAVI